MKIDREIRAIQLACERFNEEGRIEFNCDPECSEGEDGIWVQAWVFVPKEDLPPQDIWVAGYNMPGYIPDNEPAEFDTFDEAKRHIIFMMKQFEDDCGDYTPNKEVSGEDIAEEQEALATEYCHGAEEVNLQSGEFAGRFGDYIFWVTKDTK